MGIWAKSLASPTISSSNSTIRRRASLQTYSVSRISKTELFNHAAVFFACHRFLIPKIRACAGFLTRIFLEIIWILAGSAEIFETFA